jgi:hypothetical protein
MGLCWNQSGFEHGFKCVLRHGKKKGFDGENQSFVFTTTVYCGSSDWRNSNQYKGRPELLLSFP